MADSIGLVFMSMVFHHLRDRDAALNECARVLAPDGVFFMRTGSSEEAAGYPTAEFFPASVPLMQEILPRRDDLRRACEGAGFQMKHHGRLTQEIAATHAEFGEQLAAGGDSVIARLDDAERVTGLARVRQAALERDPRPVTESIDVFVFSLSGSGLPDLTAQTGPVPSDHLLDDAVVVTPR